MTSDRASFYVGQPVKVFYPRYLHNPKTTLDGVITKIGRVYVTIQIDDRDWETAQYGIGSQIEKVNVGSAREFRTIDGHTELERREAATDILKTLHSKYIRDEFKPEVPTELLEELADVVKKSQEYRRSGKEL